jgi:hypothetical protein
MNEKIDKAIQYYNVKRKQILGLVNKNNNLTVDDIITYGEELAVLEYKLTALEVSKEN